MWPFGSDDSDETESESDSHLPECDGPEIRINGTPVGWRSGKTFYFQPIEDGESGFESEVVNAVPVDELEELVEEWREKDKAAAEEGEFRQADCIGMCWSVLEHVIDEHRYPEED